jgi:hypothetical protein
MRRHVLGAVLSPPALTAAVLAHMQAGQAQRTAPGESAPPAWASYAMAGINAFTGCAAFAVGKQVRA